MWFFLKGSPHLTHTITWTKESGPGKANSLHVEDGLAICLYVRSEFGAYEVASGIARQLVETAGVNWISLRGSSWQIDLEKLAKFWPIIKRLPWLSGIVDVAPEFLSHPSGVFAIGGGLSALLFLITERTCTPAFTTPATADIAVKIPSTSMMLNKDIELIKEIADGNFGVVWEAYDHSLNRRVAVKIIKAKMSAIATVHEHAQALAQCQHKNVITVHQVTKVQLPNSGAVVDGVVMELLSGETLDQRLKSGALLQFDEVNEYLDGAISGLEHIHSRSIPHGDLHSRNVMITDQGVKLIDIDYANTASMDRLSSMTKRDLIDQDVANMRTIVRRVINHSVVDPDIAESIPDSIAASSTLSGLRSILTDLVFPQRASSTKKRPQTPDAITSNPNPASTPAEEQQATPAVLHELGLSAEDALMIKIAGDFLLGQKTNKSLISVPAVMEVAQQAGYLSDQVHDSIEVIQQFGFAQGQGRHTRFLQLTNAGMELYLTIFDSQYSGKRRKICVAVERDKLSYDTEIADLLSLPRPLVAHVLDWLQDQGHCTLQHWNTSTEISAVSPTLRRMLKVGKDI